MASTGSQAFGPVLQALATMQGNVDREQKQQANEFLEAFQKSPEAWSLTHAILQSSDVPVEAKLFAATTLKGKITYDIHQLPRESLAQLRDSLLQLLFAFRVGRENRVIRTQLCVCLAVLAVQMMEWKNVIEVVIAALGNDLDGSVCLLEFLKVLPEEVNDGRKVNLTEEEIDTRTEELLNDNAPKVLEMLVQFARSASNAATQPLVASCLTSWLREVSPMQVVSSPLLDIVIASLSSEQAFDAAVDCLCSIFKETRDVDECQDVIQILYPRILLLQQKIEEAAGQDADTFRGYTRIFAEAGEAWVVLIARLPNQFRKLVEAIAECAARDKERDVISLTFNFWYELKNYLVLENYIEARMQLADIYIKLVDVMIQHLHYPVSDTGSEEDLFDGDREQEERFREFRHAMGDVLKDCCEVLGARDCLAKSYALIKAWMDQYSATVGTPHRTVPNWQSLEAPLFSLRAMGRMVPADEAQVLPEIMNLLIRLPEHEKVRFAATLVLGRYTEWTANHPQYLEPQFNYIIRGFEHESKDVTRAAAMALRFFCQDCGKLLVGHIAQLHTFYEQVGKTMPLSSLYEVTDGVAHVVAAQPLDSIYSSLALFCEPITARLMEIANKANDEKSKHEVADTVQLLTTFASVVRPYVESGLDNPMVRFWSEVFPIMSKIVESFIDNAPICERVSKFYRTLLISYRTAMLPLLPALAEKLVACFEKSHQGCFLWVSGSVIREFQDEELVDENTRNSVYQFLERQCLNMFHILNDTSPKEIPDLIEDFFRLLIDAVMFHPFRLIPSQLLEPIFRASLASLVLEQNEPLMAVLHFLRDILAYGSQEPPTSRFKTAENPRRIREEVTRVVRLTGESLTVRIMSGLMYSFPGDCVPDSSGVLMTLVELVPEDACNWVNKTVSLLPAGSVTDFERQKFLANFQQSVIGRDWKRVRYQLQDFTNWYRRKNVTPRAGGAGGLSTPRFQFA